MSVENKERLNELEFSGLSEMQQEVLNLIHECVQDGLLSGTYKAGYNYYDDVKALIPWLKNLGYKVTERRLSDFLLLNIDWEE